MLLETREHIKSITPLQRLIEYVVTDGRSRGFDLESVGIEKYSPRADYSDGTRYDHLVTLHLGRTNMEEADREAVYAPFLFSVLRYRKEIEDLRVSYIQPEVLAS